MAMKSEVSLQGKVQDYLLESAEIQRRVSSECVESILSAAELIAKIFRSGGKVMLCGNGGSAADCQHMATEFVSRLTKEIERPGLPAIALTTDSSFLTAYSNDSGFDGVFARQVQALGKSGDLLIGISTSGRSNNVILAVQEAKGLNIPVIVLTGCEGPLSGMSDVTVSVPNSNTQYIQESHLAIEHILCELVERDMFGEGKLDDNK
jgi:D-sedoheptulose 7-phosphate isomerase